MRLEMNEDLGFTAAGIALINPVGDSRYLSVPTRWGRCAAALLLVAAVFGAGARRAALR